jgi:hypothetical protein
MSAVCAQCQPPPRSVLPAQRGTKAVAMVKSTTAARAAFQLRVNANLPFPSRADNAGHLLPLDVASRLIGFRTASSRCHPMAPNISCREVAPLLRRVLLL